MSPQISVVIPTYRRAATLARTLRALLDNDLAPTQYEVIVVDDYGEEQTQATVAALRDRGVELTYTVNPGRGAAAARNAGARIARGDVLLFLDDDMQVGRTHLADHLRTRREHPEALIGGTRWYSPESLAALTATSFGRYRISLERAYADGRGESEAEESVTVAPTLASYDLSISRGSWETLGGFDESFPYAGAEDQDLSRRAVAAGLELIRNNEIKLLHDDPTTTLRDFGQREERGAHTVIAMARKYPDILGEFRRNDPIMRGDGPRLVLQKLAKELLSLPVSLSVLHRVADGAAALGLPDRVVWPLNRIVVGLHTFLGYREALALGGRWDRPADPLQRTQSSTGAAAVSSVLMICQEFPGFAVSGGIGTYAEIVARELATRDLNVHVLCVGTGLARQSHERDGYVVHTAPYTQLRGFGRPLGLPRLGLWVSQAYSVWREYRRLGIDVDVIEAPELYAEAAAIALFERHTPLVVRLHSGFAVLAVPPDNVGPDFRLTVAVEDFAVRNADVVVSTAPHLASVAAELDLDQRRTRAIIYPVPERALAPINDSLTVLFVGRLERRKAPELVIAAAAHVLRELPDARFRFVGADTTDPERGSYRGYLSRLAHELGVQDAVDFVGPVQHDQVQTEMRDAGVCAFPSLWESFGLVVSDAGAIGRPVVVSDIPAFNDFISDGLNGRIVKGADGEAWGRALVEALSDREHSRRMGERLREELQQRAAPHVVGDQVLESYAAAKELRGRRARNVLSTYLRRAGA